MNRRMARVITTLLLALLQLPLFAAYLTPLPAQAAGATLSFTPNQGDQLVDSTFDLSLVVNTGGQAINAVEAFVTFPADKLQVVSPSVGSSFIQFWIAGPSYSNTEGKITFQGGLPSPGVNTSAGIVSTVKFRAKATGRAVIKYQDNSKVLANDGTGTNILVAKAPATLDIKLAPPGGPIVSSPTHEDSNRWYSNRTITFQWEAPPQANGYSFTLDNFPSTVPDETVDLTDAQLVKTVDADSRWFFHIRARGPSGWGGTTHFHVKIDASPPASFKPALEPKSVPIKGRGLLTFGTTDAMSGIDHYEVKLLSLSGDNRQVAFFVEATSPFQLPELDKGNYEVIVRAIDQASNYRDEKMTFEVGATLAGSTSPWLSGLLIGIFGLLALLFFIGWMRASRRRQMAPRLKADIASLQSVVSERQAELNNLVQLQQHSQTELEKIAQQPAAEIPAPLPPQSVAAPPVPPRYEPRLDPLVAPEPPQTPYR